LPIEALKYEFALSSHFIGEPVLVVQEWGSPADGKALSNNLLFMGFPFQTSSSFQVTAQVLQ